MEIRLARDCDMPEILNIYECARSFMESVGNPTQWQKSYPPRELIEKDIAEGCLRVVAEGNNILAVFYTAYGIDPTYVKIYGGSWNTPEPYGVLHRVAVAEAARGKGVVSFIFSAMLREHGSLRIDTHENNIPMQRALAKAGFSRRGIIYIKEPDGLTAEELELCRRVAYDASLAS